MSPGRDSPSSMGAAANPPDPTASTSESSTPTTTKIVIKGFSLSSSSKLNTKTTTASSVTSKIQIKQQQQPVPILGKRSRNANALHGGSDDEEGDSDAEHGRHELVTGFADGGATRHEDERHRSRNSGPLVIERQANRDWKAEMRMQRREGKNLLPPEVQAQRAAAQKGGKEKIDGVDVVNGGEEPKWGLNVKKESSVVEGMGDKGEGFEVESERKTESETIVGEEKPRVKTDDELALEALMGKDSKKKGPDLVIPIASEEEEDQKRHQPISDTDAYRRAVREAPDVSTLEDYERVPVEEFGAALLRGMGWNGEKTAGAKEVKRRQNLLGLGASHLKGAEELGAWVQKSDTRRLKGADSGRRGDRRPTASEYKREKERERERRDERHESYRRDRDRDWDRDYHRDRDRRRDYRR